MQNYKLLKKALKYYIKMHAELAKCNHAISEMKVKSEEERGRRREGLVCNILTTSLF